MSCNVFILYRLGTGTFGRVVLCRERSTREYWALKILAIADVIRLKQVQHVQNEKSILLSVNHPFIVNMSVLFKFLKSFQTDRFIYQN